MLVALGGDFFMPGADVLMADVDLLPLLRSCC